MFSWIPAPVRSVILPWSAMFVIFLFANTQDGGPNAISRFLTMRSMAEFGSFTIDGGRKATSDWAQTPDGHYYSNKAPGPMLLGFPAFFLVDQIPRLWEKGYRDENGMRHTPGYFTKTYTSFFSQAVPLMILVGFVVSWLVSLGISGRSQTFFVLSVFWGTTASLYYNNYSGHGFAAIVQLALLFFVLQRRWAWAGFFGGAALLSDYGFATEIPAFLGALWISADPRESRLRQLKEVSLGALVPAGLWVWYHTACFGSPFSLPNQFQNPIFLDEQDGSPQLWGTFHVPSMEVFFKLIAGRSRGLLPTQPWVFFSFLLAPLAFLRGYRPSLGDEGARRRQAAAVFCVLGLLGLLLMNAAFGKWQGGNSAGPRYVAGVLPCFGLWLALELDRMSKGVRLLFEGALGISLLFRAVVYGSTILAPGYPLWWWYYTEYATHHWTPQLRFTIFALLMAIGFWWQRRLSRRIATA